MRMRLRMRMQMLTRIRFSARIFKCGTDTETDADACCRPSSHQAFYIYLGLSFCPSPYLYRCASLSLFLSTSRTFRHSIPLPVSSELPMCLSV
jgi:hypothetical protein